MAKSLSMCAISVHWCHKGNLWLQEAGEFSQTISGGCHSGYSQLTSFRREKGGLPAVLLREDNLIKELQFWVSSLFGLPFMDKFAEGYISLSGSPNLIPPKIDTYLASALVSSHSLHIHAAYSSRTLPC